MNNDGTTIEIGACILLLSSKDSFEITIGAISGNNIPADFLELILSDDYLNRNINKFEHLPRGNWLDIKIRAAIGPEVDVDLWEIESIELIYAY